MKNGVSVILLDIETGWPCSICTSSQGGFANEWEAVEVSPKIGRVVIMGDMEGVSSVPNDDAAVTPAEETGGVRTAAYAEACRAMTLDVQMAVAGARAAGTQEIIVADSHWYDSNLSDDDFDVPVVRGSQAALRAMEGADAAMLIGWHAKAETARACLPHTYTDRISALKIDGRELGEIGMLFRLIASYGVPVVLVSGEEAARAEVLSDLEGVRSARIVVTKSVDEIGQVKFRHQTEIWREIVGEAFGAISSLAQQGRGHLVDHQPGQFEVVVRPQFTVEADVDAERLDSVTYRIRAEDIRSSYAAFQRFIDRLPSPGAAPMARQCN